jgi:tetratricopeptide (TPR) repeat protein
MKQILTGIVLIVLLIQAYSLGAVEVTTQYDWYFEPREDGSLLIRMTVTIGKSYSSWGFTTSKDTIITSIRAWELESGTPIDIEESDEGDRIEYLLDFQGTKGKGFQFVIEREQRDSVEEKFNQTYYLYWGWTSSRNSIHTAAVLLPKKHELLYSNYIQPEEVTSRLEQLTVHLSQELPKESTFRIGLMFSKKGVQLLKRAESAFRLNQWSDAKEAYEDAIKFYDQFSELYDKNKTEFILDLNHNLRECEEHLETERMERNTQIAEEKYAEGLAALENEEYESAKLLFTQAQNMYKSVAVHSVPCKNA